MEFDQWSKKFRENDNYGILFENSSNEVITEKTKIANLFFFSNSVS